ncbi:hypothetical protein [Methyloversatilis universalis]|uniref:hypothetical protein n=1 Tax=Methyloversatilis universalis TaxID=378211 RepID=UPI0005B772E4|nr:hypothetical protein [Methyloversatilis universalis]
MSNPWEDLDEAEVRRRRIIGETIDRVVGAVGLTSLLLLLPIYFVSPVFAEHFFWTMTAAIFGIGLLKPVLIRDGSIE